MCLLPSKKIIHSHRFSALSCISSSWSLAVAVLLDVLLQFLSLLLPSVPWDWACLSLWCPPSTLQPGSNLHLSLQLAELSESCCLPPCSQPVCKLCPFFTPAFTPFSPAMTLRLLGSPFPLSCSSLDTFQTVLCQGTVSTAVGFCHLTSSFHPCEAILQMCSLSFIPLYYSFPSCFHVSAPAVPLTQAVTHSETQRMTSHATQSCAGDYQDVPAAAGLWTGVWCFAAWTQAGNWTFPCLSFPLSSVLCISNISCPVQDNFLISCGEVSNSKRSYFCKIET